MVEINCKLNWQMFHRTLQVLQTPWGISEWQQHGFLHQNFSSATGMQGHLLQFCMYGAPKQNWSLQSQDDWRQQQTWCLPRCSVTSSRHSRCKKTYQNSTISDAHKGARYCIVDIKDFILRSTMQIYQYMHIYCRYIPQKCLLSTT